MLLHLLITGDRSIFQQEQKIIGHREFRSTLEPAVHRIEPFFPAIHGRHQQVQLEFPHRFVAELHGIVHLQTLG